MSASLPPGCDRSIAASMPQSGVAPNAAASPGISDATHSRLILATTILASSLAFIDGSVVNVGLPAIGHSLDAGAVGLSWVVNGYLLPLSALLLLGGAAGDRFGRKRLLLIGVFLFALASALCAAAPALAWLIAGRVLQGIGAALLMPNSLAILGANFSGEARGRAIGIWAAIGAAAGALGPLLGGWLIDVVGWRMIFLINLPIAALAFYLGARYLCDEPNPARPSLDLPGAMLASIGLAALTWGLTLASAQSRFNWISSTAIVAGIVFLLFFIWAEKNAGEGAMLPMSLFGSASFAGLNLLTFLLYGALGALMVLVPFVLIKVDGYSATAAGAALLPLPIVIALASSTMGRLAGKIGPRLPLTVGPLIVAVGFLLATRIGDGSSYWTTTLPAMLVIALGMAGAVAPLTTAVLSSVGTEHTGVASGFNSAVARSGGLVATALLGLVLASQGAALLAAFHAAALVAAGAAVAAAVCAFFGIKSVTI
ncbi:DHA2 family efflux MFS transporter permease subunit [Undibacterium terreum]|uniref:MFS transporter n=1 Tax=Undibacterium terreum TaxID=1224302 RepID=A0A916UIN6_9BURK|nr:DHA2 family efflux MFS transporter permease subunit [Undibacterium terreum]GGC72388.1 MFS transporter [Undibacterium terreum]